MCPLELGGRLVDGVLTAGNVLAIEVQGRCGNQLQQPFLGHTGLQGAVESLFRHHHLQVKALRLGVGGNPVVQRVAHAAGGLLQRLPVEHIHGLAARVGGIEHAQVEQGSVAAHQGQERVGHCIVSLGHPRAARESVHSHNIACGRALQHSHGLIGLCLDAGRVTVTCDDRRHRLVIHQRVAHLPAGHDGRLLRPQREGSEARNQK